MNTKLTSFNFFTNFLVVVNHGTINMVDSIIVGVALTTCRKAHWIIVIVMA